MVSVIRSNSDQTFKSSKKLQKWKYVTKVIEPNPISYIGSNFRSLIVFYVIGRKNSRKL